MTEGDYYSFSMCVSPSRPRLAMSSELLFTKYSTNYDLKSSFVRRDTVWWNSYCPERVYARGHTREHGVKKYRGQCIRLFSNTKKPYTPFDTPAPTVSLTVKNWKESWRTRKYFSNVGEKKWNFPRPCCYLSPPFFETVILLRVARNLSSSFCSSRYRVVKLILSWTHVRANMYEHRCKKI